MEGEAAGGRCVVPGDQHYKARHQQPDTALWCWTATLGVGLLRIHSN